jgi:hypothetical protein
MLMSERILQLPEREEERWAFLPTFLEQVAETVEKVLASTGVGEQGPRPSYR